VSHGSGSARLGLTAVLALSAAVAASTHARGDASGPGQSPASPNPMASPSKPAGLSPGEIQAEPPPFTEGIFPCSQCHEGRGDPKRRVLEAHEDVQAAFNHDSANRWCLDCHDNDKRDVLKLASGAFVPFTESYRLCGQCHGDKYRDWRAGVHGKRVGHWDGERTYFLCVNCHNPHSPRFKALKPEPRPARPQEMAR
jgi:hypothetical protein